MEPFISGESYEKGYDESASQGKTEVIMRVSRWYLTKAKRSTGHVRHGIISMNLKLRVKNVFLATTSQIIFQIKCERY